MSALNAIPFRTLSQHRGRLLCAILAITLGHYLSEAGEPVGLTIEAESFVRKTGEKEFAVEVLDSYASNGKALVKFFKKNGRCRYQFTVTSSAFYNIWLRYSAISRVAIPVAVDNQKLQKAPVKSTGKLSGAGAWKWARLLRVRLKAGKHLLTLAGAPIRPDCLYVTATGENPKQRDHAGIPDARIKKLLSKPIEPINPSWLAGTADYKLPEWFESTRVCAHTRLTPKWMGRPAFLKAAQGFKTLGFKVFVRHIKSAAEGVWWPSSAGGVHPLARKRNFAAEILKNARKAGLKLIVYHRHMEDDFMAKKRPDWVCVDWNAKPILTRRGKYMCFNSPYPDYVLKHLLELVAMGADGFYFDESHMPRQCCWCTHCRKKFTAETGLKHPRRADHADPVWSKLVEFNNATMERTFLKWRKELHSRKPDLVMLVGSNVYPGMVYPHINNRLMRIADSVKTEFALPARPSHNRIY